MLHNPATALHPLNSRFTMCVCWGRYGSRGKALTLFCSAILWLSVPAPPLRPGPARLQACVLVIDMRYGALSMKIMRHPPGPRLPLLLSSLRPDEPRAPAPRPAVPQAHKCSRECPPPPPRPSHPPPACLILARAPTPRSSLGCARPSASMPILDLCSTPPTTTP